jgi:hypothetical protein
LVKRSFLASINVAKKGVGFRPPVQAVVEDDNLRTVLIAGTTTDEKVPRVRIAVDETVNENHLTEYL